MRVDAPAASCKWTLAKNGFLLGLVLHLATGWVSVSPELEAAIDVPDPEERARHVENAVRTLLGQPAPA